MTVSDPRQADVDGVTRLLAEAETAEEIELPSLLAIDLITLGGAGQAVVDPGMWTTWSELDGQTRTMATVGSLTGLAGRRLLDLPGTSADGGAGGADFVDLPVHAPLALILAARTRPSVIAAPSAGGREPAFRVYGVGDEIASPRYCVVERLTRRRVSLGEDYPWAPTGPEPAGPGDLNRVYSYRLRSAASAAEYLASWAIEPAEPLPGQAWPPPRVVEIVRHHPEQQVSRERLAVEGDGFDALATWTRGDGVEFPPTRYDHTTLTSAIANLMAA